jgi:hypothetical protein
MMDLSFQQEKEKLQELMEFIYEYSIPNETKVTKEKKTKKQTKPPITLENRCIAKLSNGGQCSRQRLKDGHLCGSHVKLQPFGTISTNEIKEGKEIVSHEVFAVEIQGLVYFIDHIGNVFRTEDILNNTLNPKIIAQYVKTDNGYTIPSLGLV